MKPLKKMEQLVYAFDEQFQDLGKIKVVMAKDLHRCATCGWCGTETYDYGDGFCFGFTDFRSCVSVIVLRMFDEERILRSVEFYGSFKNMNHNLSVGSAEFTVKGPA